MIYKRKAGRAIRKHRCRTPSDCFRYLDNANQPGKGSGWIASGISIGLLLIGATGALTQLQDALNVVWNVEARPNLGVLDFIRKRVLSFGMILGIGFLLLVSLVISSVISGFSGFFH